MAQDVQTPSTADARWTKLTWDDLEEAFGSRALAKGKSYQRRVDELAQDGPRLLAWVRGTYRYATLVELRGRKTMQFNSQCSCPIGGGCKHAAAVVLTYLDALNEKQSVPDATKNDPRWAIAQGQEEEIVDDFEYDDTDSQGQPRRSKSAEQLTKFIQSKSKEELVAFALELVQQLPEVRTEILEKLALEEGDADKLIARARRLIEELSAEPAWTNHWTGEGSLPDYSKLQRTMKKLLDAGHADALLELGKRLMTRGLAQVEQSHDEGETATEVTGCLNLVFQAVLPARLTDAEKLLYVIDLELQDGYDLTQGAEVVWKRSWPKQVWSAVADALQERLDRLGTPDAEWHSRYQRERLTNMLIGALEDAGRRVEAGALAMSEAKKSGSYERVVERLMAEQRWDEARQWALEGIAQVEPQWAGIINNLRQRLAEIAKVQKDWPAVAAQRAEDFFDHPHIQALQDLVKAARKANCAEMVESAALRFLETGKRPDRHAKTKGDWPLPALSKSKPDPRAGHWPTRELPHYEVLIDLALADKDHETALRWFDAWQHAKHGAYGSATQYEDRIATAVAETHPERVLQIRLREIDGHILSSGYDAAGKLLRALRPLYERLGRTNEWPQLIAKLREEHRRRRNFMAVLDRLEKKAIVGK